MFVTIGLVLFLVATAVGVTAVLTNAGQAHLLTDHFAVFGYHVTGSTGSVFLYGMVVGTFAGIGFTVVAAAALRGATRVREARTDLKRADVATETETPEGTTPADHHAADGDTADDGTTREHRWSGLLGHRSRPEDTAVSTSSSTNSDHSSTNSDQG